MSNAIDDFNKGSKIDIATVANHGDTVGTFEVKDVRLVTPGLEGGAKSDFIRNGGSGNFKLEDEQVLIELDVELLDTDKKGHKEVVFDFVNKTDDGELRSPISKGYTKKDGSEAAPSMTYDILNSAREDFDDDRFGREFSKEQFLGAKFKMPFASGESKEGNPYFILKNTRLQMKEAKEREEYQSKESSQPTTTETKKAVAVDPSDLPF